VSQNAQINWPAELAPKVAALERILRAAGSALIAYSGGTDSSFLAAVARLVLGDKAMAVTAISASVPARERAAAAELARELGIRHREVETRELQQEEYIRNAADRCYHCKKESFRFLKQIAQQENLAAVGDGANVDDSADFRPGAQAADELGIRSPLREAGFTKADIRAASRLIGLPTADQPSSACLASRIPFGTPITPEGLRMIELAEEGLRGFGFGQLRVRAHGVLARIEVPPNAIARAAAPDVRAAIVSAVKQAGFRYVTLDLQGYRTGSLNESLPADIMSGGWKNEAVPDPELD